MKSLAPILVMLLTISAYAAEYALTDLGLGSARDINSSGRIVGNADAGGWYFDGSNRVTLKFGAHFAGAVQDLFFTANTANAIDDDNRITGAITFVPNLPSTRMAYLYETTSTLLLGSGEGLGINSGIVVGSGFVFDGAYRPLPADGSLQSVNRSRTAAGLRSQGGREEAVLFDIPTQTYKSLTGLPEKSVVNRINDQGVAVGHVEQGSRRTAFVAEQALAFLGTLGGSSSSAKAINNPGLTVGTSVAADGVDHAFVYRDIMVDLNRLIADIGWVLNSANAINDNGWIVGNGAKNGVQHAFLLKPIFVPVIARTNELSLGVYTGLTIRGSAGNVRIDVVDEIGQDWQVLTNLTFNGGALFWVDPELRPHRFYRAVKL